MTNINPINVNSQGIGAASGFGAKSKSSEEEVKEQEKPVVAEERETLSADTVLNFMAQSAVTVAPKTVDPAKYVDSASAERIAGFMADFEDVVAQNLSAITAEFPEMSESAAMATALAQTNKDM